MSSLPTDLPPPYSRIDPGAASGASAPGPSHSRQERNGIPPDHRRSMEDQHRELPQGWVRQFDAKQNHHFYVDTKATPPRRIWQHPYDDEQFLKTLPSAERERIESLTRHSSFHDILAESSDEDASSPTAAKTSNAELPPRPDKAGKGISWGRKLKDKITNSTHEEREAARKQRAEEERRAYEQHLHTRRAMQKAIETGEPQLLGKDREGRDVYIEPPTGYSGGYGGYGGYRPYGVNPFAQGPYYGSSSRYYQPYDSYSRPYGRGYGGGYGLPIAGGLVGGLLLGDLAFGGLGGGFGDMGGMGMGGMGA